MMRLWIFLILIDSVAYITLVKREKKETIGMNKQGVVRLILAGSREFKEFWQGNGPFKFALTSRDYPPILLDEEEWLFSNDMVALLKELMQFDRQKMKFVKSPFNSANKAVLRPEDLSEWKIVHFPEKWHGLVSDCFVPEGHVTNAVLEKIGKTCDPATAAAVEQAFFVCLKKEIWQLGYLLFKPVKGAKRAAVQSYLKEWEQDERDAGLL